MMTEIFDDGKILTTEIFLCSYLCYCEARPNGAVKHHDEDALWHLAPRTCAKHYQGITDEIKQAI